MFLEPGLPWYLPSAWTFSGTSAFAVFLTEVQLRACPFLCAPPNSLTHSSASACLAAGSGDLSWPFAPPGPLCVIKKCTASLYHRVRSKGLGISCDLESCGLAQWQVPVLVSGHFCQTFVPLTKPVPNYDLIWRHWLGGVLNALPQQRELGEGLSHVKTLVAAT